MFETDLSKLMYERKVLEGVYQIIEEIDYIPNFGEIYEISSHGEGIILPEIVATLMMLGFDVSIEIYDTEDGRVGSTVFVFLNSKEKMGKLKKIDTSESSFYSDSYIRKYKKKISDFQEGKKWEKIVGLIYEDFRNMLED